MKRSLFLLGQVLLGEFIALCFMWVGKVSDWRAVVLLFLAPLIFFLHPSIVEKIPQIVTWIYSKKSEDDKDEST